MSRHCSCCQHMFNCFCKWFCRYRWFLFWIAVILGGGWGLYVWGGSLLPDGPSSTPGTSSPENEIRSWLQFISGSATVGLVMIAWTQINRIIDKNCAELLLHIDGALRHESIVRAKCIIQRLKAIHAKESNKFEKIAEEIAKLSSSEKKEDIENIVDLINYFNFLDMLGYFYCKGHIKLEDVSDILGEPVIDLYKMAKLHIEKEQQQSNFIYFRRLYGDLKDHKKSGINCNPTG